MILIKKTDALIQHLQQVSATRCNIGFVPTMGALHQGHLSLIGASRQQNKVTVCSIFVNPTQFNNPEDFKKYPITIEKDIEMLVNAGCDILFLPTVEEIYPKRIAENNIYDLGYLETILEGKFRPGHFQGVCRVMHRLLDIVKPQHLYMGQKDYQQCMVVKKLIQILAIDTQLHTCATLREADGLAMSSRNVRLSKEQREKAIAIYKTLMFLQQKITTGSLLKVINDSKLILTANNFITDYVEIADADTLSLLTSWDGKQKIVAVIAAFQNEVRLIDNMVLN